MLTILNYNENKVKEGVAKCIEQNSFGCPVDLLTFYDKLHGLEAFMKQNRRATTKAVHISLNFHPDEKLRESTLKEIAQEYMEKIGFSNQPYLVYQHFDAGHPHIHIVTTNIQKDGSRIVLYRIGKYESEKAREAIESKYYLIRAAGRKQETKTANDTHRILYGKSETKRNVSNVVRFVIKQYKYTSLPEFNAVLSQFNIVADRGSEKSRMFIKGGLHYRIIDDHGRKIGVPIKASSILGKPTLKYLEKQFKLNQALRRAHKARLINCIDQAFRNKQTVMKSAFVKALNQENIYVLFRQSDEGRAYGITFVDNMTKVVFNGSDLGKSYGAKAITERLTGLSKPDSLVVQSATIQSHYEKPVDTDSSLDETIKDLTTARSYDYTSPDAALKRRRRKKKKRGPSM